MVDDFFSNFDCETDVEITAELVKETDNSVLVDYDGDVFWLPKSKIEYENAGSGLVYVTMPEWLAYNKGAV